MSLTRRDDDGMWSQPVMLAVNAIRGAWSPAGDEVLYATNGAIAAVDVASHTSRILYQPAEPTDPRALLVALSDDGRTVYFKTQAERASFWAVPVTGGRPEWLVDFRDLARPSIRRDFAVGAGRFFFTLEDRQADVWVAEIARN